MNKPTPNAAPIWPDGYRKWTGDFNDLVRTVGEIVAGLNPGAKPPSGSLIRHYQQIGCVGRGQKQGRANTFGFDELFQAVASKDMAGSGMGLELASHLMTNSAPAMHEAYADLQPQKNGAQTLVERLLRQSQPGGAHAAANIPVGSIGGGLVRSSALNAAASISPTMSGSISHNVSRHIKPCEGVDVYLAIDPTDHDGLRRAATALRAAADSLEQPITPRSPQS